MFLSCCEIHAAVLCPFPRSVWEGWGCRSCHQTWLWPVFLTVTVLALNHFSLLSHLLLPHAPKSGNILRNKVHWESKLVFHLLRRTTSHSCCKKKRSRAIHSSLPTPPTPGPQKPTCLSCRCFDRHYQVRCSVAHLKPQHLGQRRGKEV